MVNTSVALFVFVVGFAVTFGLSMVAKYSSKRRLWTKAYIADTMVPLISRNLTPKSTLRIVGADCRYLGEKAKWRQAMEDWMAKGCKVQYLIYKPHEKAVRVLKELGEKSCGAFCYKEMLAPEDVKDVDGDKELLAELETFHFIVADQPRQKWIEGNHPVDKTEAYDCEFVPPSMAEHDPRFHEYKVVFDKVWNKYSRSMS